MRSLALITVLIGWLAQQPVKPPPSQGTPKSHNTQATNPSSTSQKHEQPTAQPALTPKPNEATAIQQNETKPINSNPDRSQTGKNHDDENLRIQRKLAWFTGALVVVGFLQFLILGFQAWV